MQVMKWSVIALAVAAGTTQMAMASSQSESKGFVEDSSFNILNRNLYFSRDFRNAGPDTTDDPQEWGHGIIGTFESGFTQGTVGVGVDAIGMMGIKLDSGKGRTGTGLFPTSTDDGRSQDSYGESGAAVKFRISNTVYLAAAIASLKISLRRFITLTLKIRSRNTMAMLITHTGSAMTSR